uniref:AlNc14C303G10404 protein n=1 Tax=Albugo laibachii Nc14 TaxID=890382 RepID=F0WVR5_9STRA|nr:AlNc14C303G10404 [Albugo laibachii Nc14]|eukprot:CCA25511.1 AlNc14C303G10404 [Albugo laibachii Nc14]
MLLSNVFVAGFLQLAVVAAKSALRSLTEQNLEPIIRGTIVLPEIEAWGPLYCPARSKLQGDSDINSFAGNCLNKPEDDTCLVKFTGIMLTIRFNILKLLYPDSGDKDALGFIQYVFREKGYQFIAQDHQEYASVLNAAIRQSEYRDWLPAAGKTDSSDKDDLITALALIFAFSCAGTTY